MGPETNTLFIIVLISLLGLFIFLRYVPFALWLTARITGIRISLMDLVFMKFRKVKPEIIVRSLIEVDKAGLGIRKDELEAHFLAEGNLENVIHGLIYAKQNQKRLSFIEASRLDLSGIDIIAKLKEEK